MQVFDLSQGVIRHKLGRTVIDFDLLIIRRILVDKFDIVLLVREIHGIVPIDGFL